MTRKGDSAATMDGMSTDRHPETPFDRSWWIDPGRILGGCYPGDLDPVKAEAKLAALYRAGVRTILCLQPEEERGRGGRPFAAYVETWRTVGLDAGEPVDWQRHPISDMGVPTLERMRGILDAVDRAKGVVYVHCWGGHGRTGTVAACHLVRHGLTPETAFERILAARSSDAHLRSYPSPQTPEQRDFAKRWADVDPGIVRRLDGPESTAVYAWWADGDPVRGRRLGAMLGAACGDALGTTLEFSRPGPKRWSPLLDGPHREITGGGPFEVVPGQVTDDTQMAACLAATLADHDGVYDADDAARRYLCWLRPAFDVGGQTRAALAEFGRIGDPATCGITVWRERGRNAAGNGSLMRCMPIGALIRDPAARREAAIFDSLITHADPRCALACTRYVAAVACAIDGGDAAAMCEAARAEDAPAADLLFRLMPEEESHIAAANGDLDQDLELAEADDPNLYGEIDLAGSAMGFVRTAFRLAFWELLHADGYEAGVIDAVNRGGDADTNGAIVGGLLGARYGLDGIRPEWLGTVLECRPKPPWDREYHPRVFVDALRITAERAKR